MKFHNRRVATLAELHIAVKAHAGTQRCPMNAAVLAESEHLDHRADFLKGLGHFSRNSLAPKGPGLCSMKRAVSRELDVFKELCMSAASTHFKAALLRSTAAPLSRLFDQHVSAFASWHLLI